MEPSNQSCDYKHELDYRSEMAAQKGIAFGWDLSNGLLTAELELICVLSTPDAATMAPESVLPQPAWIVLEDDLVLEARMKSSPGTLTNECEPGLIAMSAPSSVPLNVLAEHRPFSSHRSARHGILGFGIGSSSDLSVGSLAHASISHPKASVSRSEC